MSLPPVLPRARCTTACCRRPSGSSTAAPRSRPSPRRRCHRTAGSRSGPTGDLLRLTIRWFGSRHVLRAGAPSVHRARSAPGAGDRRGALAPLPGRVRPEAAARARRAVPGRDRGPVCRRVPRRAGMLPAVRRRGPTGWRRRSKCFASPRCRATRTDRSRRCVDPRRGGGRPPRRCPTTRRSASRRR